MIRDRVSDYLMTAYEDHLLIIDQEDFNALFDYPEMLEELGYEVIPYRHIEAFRLRYEREIKGSNQKIALVVDDDLYLPYDIRKFFYEVELSLKKLYPNLNHKILKDNSRDLALIDEAYQSLFENFSSEAKTEQFIKDQVFSPDNIKTHLTVWDEVLESRMKDNLSYRDWIEIAQLNAKLEYYAVQIGRERDQRRLNECFGDFIDEQYSCLRNEPPVAAPPILTRTLDVLTRDGDKKIALIVADGMSLFDFEILVRYLQDFKLEEEGSYALIPTLTSFSRQSLLSGDYPRQLEDPFTVSKERSTFFAALEKLGYHRRQITYERGFNPDLGPSIRFAAIIFNTIDDLVHGQKQGRQGMLQDVSLWAQSGEFQRLLKQLIEAGFSIVLTADHGNTLSRGVGRRRGAGVETETKSRRVIILKDFAEVSEDLKDKTHEFNSLYLDANYKYLLSKDNTSFDHKDEWVMSHGGSSIEEVIVPFVKIGEKDYE